jgi:membrane protein DedA with SNARE-associated domain
LEAGVGIQLSILQALVDFAVDVIDALGYAGIFLLMVLESMVFPVPSEGVMPFAGFLAAEGRFHSVWFVALVGTLGTIAGSGLSYFIGLQWGDAFVRRFGKWFLISQHDWELTQRFFQKTGGWSIFIARFLPAIRHLISMPAGAARMPLVPFLMATAVGGFGWNYFLAYVGFKLGENWERVGAWLEPFDLVIVGMLACLVLLYLVIHVRRMRRPGKRTERSEPRQTEP